MAEIFYHAVPTDWRKEQKYRFLDDHPDVSKLEWKQIKPDKHFNWLTEGMSEHFESFLPMGTKQGGEETIFTLFSNGVKTNRDTWAWNFRRDVLAANMKRMIEAYNDHVLRWPHRADKSKKADDFVTYDPVRIAWSRDLKADMERGRTAEFAEHKLRCAIYRPFTKQWLFFDRILNEEVYSLDSIFPTAATEAENRVIWLKVGAAVPFFALAVKGIPEVLPYGGSQCFPFYTYAEDGSGRRENITDWALQEFQTRYPASPDTRHPPLTKWDIFHYVYAVLHHPEYRARYAANLRRELPRIPFVAADVSPLKSPSADSAAKKVRADSRRLLPDAEVFHAFAAAGKRLAELHVGYEQQPEYPLERIEKPGEKLNWRVEKMKLTKTGAAPLTRSSTTLSPSDGERDGVRGTLAIRYNDFLSLAGIPAEVLDYRLGNRSALDWVIDQYQVSTDKRSGITNDPNRPDDPECIVRLLGQVITVSLETVKVVEGLPSLGK